MDTRKRTEQAEEAEVVVDAWLPFSNASIQCINYLLEKEIEGGIVLFKLRKCQKMFIPIETFVITLEHFAGGDLAAGVLDRAPHVVNPLGQLKETCQYQLIVSGVCISILQDEDCRNVNRSSWI